MPTTCRGLSIHPFAARTKEQPGEDVDLHTPDSQRTVTPAERGLNPEPQFLGNDARKVVDDRISIYCQVACDHSLGLPLAEGATVTQQPAHARVLPPRGGVLAHPPRQRPTFLVGLPCNRDASVPRCRQLEDPDDNGGLVCVDLPPGPVRFRGCPTRAVAVGHDRHTALALLLELLADAPCLSRTLFVCTREQQDRKQEGGRVLDSGLVPFVSVDERDHAHACTHDRGQQSNCFRNRGTAESV